MVDKKAEILIDASKKVYLSLCDTVINIYDNAFSGGLKWTKTEILQDFDAYIQAMLTSIALSNEKLTVSEAELISSLCRYGTVFDGIDIKLFADCNYEMRSRLNELCQDALKKLPIICQLTGVIDIKQDKRLTKFLLDGLIKLGFNLCSLEGSPDMAVIKNSLKSITDFIVSKSIKLN